MKRKEKFVLNFIYRIILLSGDFKEHNLRTPYWGLILCFKITKNL